MNSNVSLPKLCHIESDDIRFTDDFDQLRIMIYIDSHVLYET